MGRLSALRKHRRQLTSALDIISQIIVFYPSFIPAYIERMYTLLELAAWEQLNDAIQRLTALMPDSIDANALLCLVELCREGNSTAAGAYLNKLHQVRQMTVN